MLSIKRKERSIKEIQDKLPEGWEIIPKYFNEDSEYAIVRIKKDDVERIRLLKLPEAVRDYFREKNREQRAKQKRARFAVRQREFKRSRK